MLAAAPEDLGTRGFGPGLSKKSVLLVGGEQDTVTPPAAMVNSVAQACAKVPGLRVRHENLSGDYSFSWSRRRLTGVVLDWLQADCR